MPEMRRVECKVHALVRYSNILHPYRNDESRFESPYFGRESSASFLQPQAQPLGSGDSGNSGQGNVKADSVLNLFRVLLVQMWKSFCMRGVRFHACPYQWVVGLRKTESVCVCLCACVAYLWLQCA